MSCTPEIRKTELRWGFLTSIVSGGICTGAMFYSSAAGWDSRTAFPLIMFLVGLLGHAMDIIVAKRCFGSWRDPRRVDIYGYSNSDWGKRIAWYGKSLASMAFVRHLMVSLLDALVVSVVSGIVSRQAKSYGVRIPPKTMDPLVASFVGLITFNLYVNVLRFSWVYQNDPDMVLTIIVSMWLFFVIYYNFDQPPPQIPTDSSRNAVRYFAPGVAKLG